MSLRIAALLLLVASTTFAQQPHWYVLLEPGNERWYHGENGIHFHELVTGYDGDYSVVERSMYYDDELYDTWQELWLIEPDGDVWCGETCYIDMPLEIGKNWGRTWGEWNQYSDWFTILGWDDYDGWPCIMIREVYDGEGYDNPFITVRWYNDGMGLVYFASSCAYCHFTLEPLVVPIQPMTWSDVKALFE